MENVKPSTCSLSKVLKGHCFKLDFEELFLLIATLKKKQWASFDVKIKTFGIVIISSLYNGTRS